MVACCQRLRGHRTVSKVRASVLRTRNCQKTRPKLSCRKASSEQFSLQVPLERCQRWWRGHLGRQTVPHPSRRHGKSAVADGGEAGEGTVCGTRDNCVMLSCTGSMWQIGSRSSSVWRCISVFTVMPRTIPVRAVHAGRPSRRTTASSKVRPTAAYSSCQEYSSTRTAVVRSSWLVRPSGTHWATICAIQISASPASVAYWRRTCFSSMRRIERIRGTCAIMRCHINWHWHNGRISW